MKDYLADIHKLSRWRESAAKTRCGTKVQTIFMGVDTRTSGLPDADVATLVSESKRLGNGLIYISRNSARGILSFSPAHN